MNGYVTYARSKTIYDLPIQLPQTELRRGRIITAGKIQISLGQVMRVRLFTLHLINIITPDSVPDIFSNALGLASAGVYLGPMVCSSGLLMRASAPGIVAFNSFQYRDFSTPGVYSFIVSNNTSNIDMTVALTGVAKIFNG